ncbi:MAU2 chromatid cohesion factor-like protein [Hypsibius exemplaris]|uniref:MAU2 chromatid cohesion factor homolog n=1 Tax=Hypsibius exemplaris TaxID=2072580 RepID=A0A1W0WZF3_HYPEX|nr:MAU2 chromatid cohesion factor-like protein [Hypsibius exemplaris]
MNSNPSTSQFPPVQPSWQQDPGALWTDAGQYEMYLALLGLAESLKNQGNGEGCYKCLMGILNLTIPYNVTARIHCEVGKLLLRQTTNQDLAKQYLDSAFQLCQNAAAGSALEDTKLDAASCLAELCEIQGNISQARDILHGAIEQSQHSPYWQCNFIFQLAKVFLQGQDFSVATQILTLGESFSARHQAQYLNLLFQLTRAHVQLRARQYQAAALVLSNIQTQLDSVSQTGIIAPLLREELRFYLLSLEVLCQLGLGRAKSSRQYVLGLQTCSDTVTQLKATSSPLSPQGLSPDSTCHPLEAFTLAPTNLLPALTFALSAQFFGIIGYHDKLDRLGGRTIAYLNGLESIEPSPVQDALRLAMYQNLIPASLTSGRLNQALEEVSQYVALCAKDPKALQTHKNQLHTMLGMCALQFGYYDVAESQLNLAYRLSLTNESTIFVSLNMALLYFRRQRFQEMAAIVQRIRPDITHTDHVGLRCAVVVVQGLLAFVERRGADAKMLLRNGLQLSNEEDLNQLMAVALMLMAKNCAGLNEFHDVVKVAKTAYDLAEKIPDQTLQAAAVTSLSEVYALLGDFPNQSNAVACLQRFSQREHQETTLVRQNPKLNVIQWTEAVAQ